MMSNWRQELSKTAKSIKYLIFHGMSARNSLRQLTRLAARPHGIPCLMIRLWRQMMRLIVPVDTIEHWIPTSRLPTCTVNGKYSSFCISFHGVTRTSVLESTIFHLQIWQYGCMNVRISWSKVTKKKAYIVMQCMFAEKDISESIISLNIYEI